MSVYIGSSCFFLNKQRITEIICPYTELINIKSYQDKSIFYTLRIRDCDLSLIINSWAKIYKLIYKAEIRDNIKCIIFQSPDLRNFNKSSLEHLVMLQDILPESLSFVFEFMDEKWFSNKTVRRLFKVNLNWCISTTFIENRIFLPGWGNKVKSTTTVGPMHKIMKTTDFVYIVLYGTLGDGLGSYDENDFMLRLSKKIDRLVRKNNEVYVIFENTLSNSVLYPIPSYVIPNTNIRFDFKLRSSIGLTANIPCHLHDVDKLSKSLDEIKKSRYKFDCDGYVQTFFVSRI